MNKYLKIAISIIVGAVFWYTAFHNGHIIASSKYEWYHLANLSGSVLIIAFVLVYIILQFVEDLSIDSTTQRVILLEEEVEHIKDFLIL